MLEGGGIQFYSGVQPLRSYLYFTRWSYTHAYTTVLSRFSRFWKENIKLVKMGGGEVKNAGIPSSTLFWLWIQCDQLSHASITTAKSHSLPCLLSLKNCISSNCDQHKSFLPYVAFVRCFVTATKVANEICQSQFPYPSKVSFRNEEVNQDIPRRTITNTCH